MIYGKNYEFFKNKIQEGLPPKGTFGRDEILCQRQIQVSKVGFTEVRLVETIYGYSVRYASGLNNFAVLFGGRMMGRIVSYEEALSWAKEWVDEKPEYRAVSYDQKCDGCSLDYHGEVRS